VRQNAHNRLHREPNSAKSRQNNPNLELISAAHYDDGCHPILFRGSVSYHVRHDHQNRQCLTHPFVHEMYKGPSLILNSPQTAQPSIINLKNGSQTLRLSSSTCTKRVAVVLKEKNVPFELIAVDFVKGNTSLRPT